MGRGVGVGGWVGGGGGGGDRVGGGGVREYLPSTTRDVIRATCSILTQKGKEKTTADGTHLKVSMDCS